MWGERGCDQRRDACGCALSGASRPPPISAVTYASPSCVRRLCPGFVCAISMCHRSEPNAWTMACPCGPSCACFSAFRCQRSGCASVSPVCEAAEGCSLSGAAVRYDRFYHLRRPSCQHLNRGNLLSCVVPASRLPVTLTATVVKGKGNPRYPVAVRGVRIRARAYCDSYCVIAK